MFAVVFAFLAAIVIGFRFLLRLGGGSQPGEVRTALRSIASEALAIPVTELLPKLDPTKRLGENIEKLRAKRPPRPK